MPAGFRRSPDLGGRGKWHSVAPAVEHALIRGGYNPVIGMKTRAKIPLILRLRKPEFSSRCRELGTCTPVAGNAYGPRVKITAGFDRPVCGISAVHVSAMSPGTDVNLATPGELRSLPAGTIQSDAAHV